MKGKTNIAAAFVSAAVLVLGFLFFASDASAQTRRRQPNRRTTKPPAAKPAPPAAANVSASAEVRDGAEKVSTQLKNVTKFIFVLGGVARGIEDIDKEARSGRVSRAVLDQNAKYKQSVIESIRNLRAGLAALEIEFRTKPALRTHLAHINGIAEMTGAAEDQAAAGQLTAAGKTLLEIVEKLSDTLAALP